MKKTAVALMLILMLSVLAVNCLVNLAEANPEPAIDAKSYGIHILSPENKTYFVSTVNLNIKVTSYWTGFGSFRISVDGGPWIYQYDYIENSTEYHFDWLVTYCKPIPLNLTDGSHTITVKIQREGILTYCNNVTFTVDTVSPIVSVISPENKTYNTATIPLVFTSYRLSDIQYSLDGKPNVPIVKETVLRVSDGFHSLVYYGTAVDGAPYVSEAVNFAVDTGPPRIEVLSIENKTYYTGDLVLDFSVSEPLVKMGYSLDGARVVVDGNVSLTGLSWGSHFITVHGYDSVSGTYVFTSPIFFSIFPAGLVIATVITVVVFAVFLLMRKHKH